METLAHVVRGLIGIVAFLGLAFLFSSNRRAVPWKLVAAGMVLQLVFAFAVLKVPVFEVVMNAAASFFVRILDFSLEGAAFLFGPLVTDDKAFPFIFAFKVLPTIVFFAAFTSALYYLGILQRVVFAFAWVMSKTMRLSGAESLSAAANIFVGQTEAPLLIRPYIAKMTRSEILCVMIAGMATIAGGVMAGYVGMLGGNTEAGRQLFALHLLTASILSAPAAVLTSKILLPETEAIETELLIPRERIGANFLDALANGTTDGLKLALNVAAMLIAFIALIALVNWCFARGLGSWTGLNAWAAAISHGRYHEFNLQFAFGVAFAPLAWLMGVPNHDLLVAGQLLGEKTVINEFVAYGSLAQLKDAGAFADLRSVIILTYALCGFSNISSIGIQIGGIGALAPNQRPTLAALGIKALIGGSIACFLTACVAAMLT